MKIFFTFLFITGFLFFNAQTVFGPVEKRGFGQLQYDGYNNSINDMKAFKGKLYVSAGEDSGYVYSSSTGDMGSFTRTYAEYQIKRLRNFEVSNDVGGFFYMSTYSNGALKPMVKRTADGINCDNYYEANDYYDEISNIAAFKGVQSFDSIYVAVNISGQNLLLRNSVTQNDPYNSLLTWDTIADVSSAFGTAGYTNASAVFNGKLYYAMDNNKLFETEDGRSVTENMNYENQVGYSSTSVVDRTTCLASFGGYLYLGTTANITGAQIWRTADGVTFDSLAIPNASFAGVKSMKVAGGKLFILIRDYSDAYVLYSTVDGTTYVLEDNTEFGNGLTNANYNTPMEEFNGHLYVGVTQTFGGLRLIGNGNNEIMDYNSTGGQIYRTCLTGPMPSVSILEPDSNIVCSGANITFNGSGAVNYLWNTGSTNSSITVNAPGLYAVTTVDGNNCRNSDDVYLYNHNSPLPIVIDPWYYIASNAVICNGDTTQSHYGADPLNDQNCLVSTGGNTGLLSPAGSVMNGSDLTIEAWVYPQGNGVIASAFDPSLNWSFNDNWMMRVGGIYNDELYINLENVGGTFVGYLTANHWNHVVLRYVNSTYELKGYINGYPNNQINGSGAYAPASYWGYQDAYKFMNDANYPSFEPGLPGKIRDIRIWNIARTDSAILADKHVLPPGVYPNLLFQYETLETSGSVAADSSGNGYNASVTGTFVSPTPVTWVADPTMSVVGFNSAIFFPTVETSYALQYTDTYGCVVTDSFKVEPAYLDINGIPGASCGGSAATLQFYSNISMGSVDWTSATIGTISNYSVTLTPASDEWVYVSESNTGCLLTDSFLVKVGPAFVSGLGAEPPVSACENTNVVLHALASGGTAPFTYIWGNGTVNDTTNVDSLVYNVGSNNSLIYVSGYDSIGCYFQVSGFNGFTVSYINSTDITGHITTPAALDLDNGEVYIFKHQPGNAGFDTVGYATLDAFGRYNYLGVDAGDYLIKVMPDETNFPNAVPTYYGNAFQWDSSLVFNHGCVQQDTSDIQVVEISGPAGTATVSGYIIEEQGFGNNRLGDGGGIYNPFVPGGPLKGIDVKLGKNPGGGIQARVMTDSTGKYEFTNIPAGGYRIYVDIPNLPMDSTREITLAANDSSVQNNYFADSASIYINTNTIGLYTSNKKFENNFTVYPNPAKDILYLSYELKAAANVSFEITNVIGETMMREPSKGYTEGKNTRIINLDNYNLPAGIYFINLNSEGNTYTQRLVIVE